MKFLKEIAENVIGWIFAILITLVILFGTKFIISIFFDIAYKIF